MTFFTWRELWGTRIQHVIAVPLWRAMILGFDMFLIGHLEWEQPQERGTYNHHSTGISMVLGKWIVNPYILVGWIRPRYKPTY